MKKAVAMLVASGVLALGMASSAFAQSAVAVRLVNTPSGQAFARAAVGNATASGQQLAELLTAKMIASPAIAKAVSDFSAGSKDAEKGTPAERAAAKTANERLASSIFSVNGQPVTVAALTAKYGERTGTDQAANRGAKCDLNLLASQMINKPGVRGINVTRAVELMQKKAVLPGDCNPEGIASLESGQSIENLFQTGDCLDQNNFQSLRGEQLIALGGGCLLKAKEDDAGVARGSLNLATETEHYRKIATSCHYLPQ